jgi:hypothetical protein
LGVANPNFKWFPATSGFTLFHCAATDATPVLHTGSVLIDHSDELLNDGRKAIEAATDHRLSTERGKDGTRTIANQKKTMPLWKKRFIGVEAD